MVSTVFYSDLNMILTKRKWLQWSFRRSKHDFHRQKMASMVFYGDLNMILMKRKWHRRCFTAIYIWFWRREYGFDGHLRQYKYDFDKEKMALTVCYSDLNKIFTKRKKMASTAFYGDLRMILAKRKWLRRSFCCDLNMILAKVKWLRRTSTAI